MLRKDESIARFYTLVVFTTNEFHETLAIPIHFRDRSDALAAFEEEEEDGSPAAVVYSMCADARQEGDRVIAIRGRLPLDWQGPGAVFTGEPERNMPGNDKPHRALLRDTRAQAPLFVLD